MAYFSNGTEGMVFEDVYCCRCVHYREPDDGGCPVWILHLLWNYEQNKDEDKRLALDLLITGNGFTEPYQCEMFHKAPSKE